MFLIDDISIRVLALPYIFTANRAFANSELVRYVRDKLEHGFSKAEIIIELKRVGWRNKDIHTAINAVGFGYRSSKVAVFWEGISTLLGIAISGGIVAILMHSNIGLKIQNALTYDFLNGALRSPDFLVPVLMAVPILLIVFFSGPLAFVVYSMVFNAKSFIYAGFVGSTINLISLALLFLGGAVLMQQGPGPSADYTIFFVVGGGAFLLALCNMMFLYPYFYKKFAKKFNAR